MELPEINPCKMTKAPARLQFRREFHEGDTIEKHLDRYGLTIHAPRIILEAQKIAADFQKEHPGKLNMEDFRITSTVGQNATGWRHPLHPEEESAKHIPAEIVEAAKQKMIADCINEWNAANPKV